MIKRTLHFKTCFYDALLVISSKSGSVFVRLLKVPDSWRFLSIDGLQSWVSYARLTKSSPASFLASPYFFRRIAWTLMKPPVSTGSNEPISSIELSSMS